MKTSKLIINHNIKAFLKIVRDTMKVKFLFGFYFLKSADDMAFVIYNGFEIWVGFTIIGKRCHGI